MRLHLKINEFYNSIKLTTTAQQTIPVISPIDTRDSGYFQRVIHPTYSVTNITDHMIKEFCKKTNINYEGLQFAGKGKYSMVYIDKSDIIGGGVYKFTLSLNDAEAANIIANINKTVPKDIGKHLPKIKSVKSANVHHDEINEKTNISPIKMYAVETEYLVPLSGHLKKYIFPKSEGSSSLEKLPTTKNELLNIVRNTQLFEKLTLETYAGDDSNIKELLKAAANKFSSTDISNIDVSSPRLQSLYAKYKTHSDTISKIHDEMYENPTSSKEDLEKINRRISDHYEMMENIKRQISVLPLNLMNILEVAFTCINKVLESMFVKENKPEKLGDYRRTMNNCFIRALTNIVTSKPYLPNSSTELEKAPSFYKTMLENSPETAGLMVTLDYLEKAGIKFSDLHSGNLMQRPSTGDVVLSDVGNFKYKEFISKEEISTI